MSDILSLQETQDHLYSQVFDKDQALFRKLRHSQLEGAFHGRILIVYKAKGKDPNGVPNPPVILARLRIVDFEANSQYGCETLIKDIETGEELWVGSIPERLWDYDIFMQTPPRVTLQWKAREHDEKTVFTLVFGIILRMADRSESCTAGATYCLSPKRFKELYPNAPLDLY